MLKAEVRSKYKEYLLLPKSPQCWIMRQSPWGSAARRSISIAMCDHRTPSNPHWHIRCMHNVGLCWINDWWALPRPYTINSSLACTPTGGPYQGPTQLKAHWPAHRLVALPRPYTINISLACTQTGGPIPRPYTINISLACTPTGGPIPRPQYISHLPHLDNNISCLFKLAHNYYCWTSMIGFLFSRYSELIYMSMCYINIKPFQHFHIYFIFIDYYFMHASCFLCSNSVPNCRIFMCRSIF